MGKTVEVAADLIIRTNKLLSEVRFAVDGRPIGAAKSSPYAVSWNTRQYGAGEHEILAKAIFTDETIIQDTIKVIVTKEMSIQFKSPNPLCSDDRYLFIFPGNLCVQGYCKNTKWQDCQYYS